MRAGASAGIIRTNVFTNSTPASHYVSANGTWLAGPDAALIGSANGSDVPHAVLLALSSPMYDAATQVRATSAAYFLFFQICPSGRAHAEPVP